MIRFMQWCVISSPEMYTIAGATILLISRLDMYRDDMALTRLTPISHSSIRLCFQVRVSHCSEPLNPRAANIMLVTLMDRAILKFHDDGKLYGTVGQSIVGSCTVS